MGRSSLGRLWRNDEGTALVEATLVVPVILTLAAGVYEFSWYFYKQQLVETGVRDAARYLARTAPDSAPNPCSDTAKVTIAQNIATYGAAQTTDGAQRVATWNPSDVTLTCTAITNSSGSYLGAASIYIVTASTSFPDPSLGFFSLLGLNPPDLSASHAQRSIGPG
ncbi:MAG: TadE/TadG family type IV pilus assembly protein [Xanthobacteraceae bacterium]